MKALHQCLLEASIHAALASMEVYNKPDFKFREQTFTILIVNTWELLLKAKIVKDNAESVESIYATDKDGAHKTNRSGNPMTIDVTWAAKRCALDANVVNNLEHLVDIRDTAAHFYHDSALAYVVYTLGVASLKNYQHLVQEWFGHSLLDYNFYILPLAFAYNFQTLSAIDLNSKPEVLANLIRSVTSSQSEENDSTFHFVCEVSTQLVSAKKFVGDADVVAKIDSSAPPGAVVVERLQKLTDKYPFSYRQLWSKVKEEKPHVKQGELTAVMKRLNVKGDARYSSYSFATKEQRDRYESTGQMAKHQTCIYNDDALQIVLSNLP